MPRQYVVTLWLLAVLCTSLCSAHTNYVLDVRLTGDIIVEENFPAFINNIPVNNITLPKCK
jgi:hypothetical protein